MRPAVFTAVLLLVGIINTVTALCALHPKEICPKLKLSPCKDLGWIRFGRSRCMKYFKTPKNFKDAEEHCECQDGDLMSMHGHVENIQAMCLSFRFGSSSRPVQFWIGVHRSKDGFKNMDGTKFHYSNWAPNEPNNHGGKFEGCVESNFGKWGKWNDAPCSTKRDFVCIKKK